MSDNLDHHHDVYHYGGDPTPPTPPEMPKPDKRDWVRISNIDGPTYQTTWYSDSVVSPIEWYALQQHARAEKAEQELVYKQDHIDEEVAINKMLQTENAALRAALERTEHDLRRYDPSCDECNGIRPRPDKMRERITQALHSSPAAGGKDEDE